MSSIKAISVQGEAWYNGEQVTIMDTIGFSGTGRVECMINYGGPVWVDIHDLTNVVWYI
jgi:hypothetical protein